MLTDELRHQIAAEETLRDEVRRSLEAQKPPPSTAARAWALMNSSFVLWLLSSVVVALVTAAYTTYQSRQAEAMRTQELVRRLDIEIGNRIFYARVDFTRLGQNLEHVNAKTSARGLYANVLLYLNNDWDERNQDFSVFAEYKERSFSSLLLELELLVDPEQRDDIERARAAYAHLAIDSADYTKEPALERVGSPVIPPALSGDAPVLPDVPRDEPAESHRRD